MQQPKLQPDVATHISRRSLPLTHVPLPVDGAALVLYKQVFVFKGALAPGPGKGRGAKRKQQQQQEGTAAGATKRTRR